MQQVLGQLITDARDVLDAVQFYSGTGTDSPAGVRTGLTTTQRVLTDVAATLDIDDVWDIKGQLPARFMPNATFGLHPSKADAVFRFTPSGSTTEPQAMPTRDGALCGRPKIEWTAIPTALTTGTTQLLYGDFRGRVPYRRSFGHDGRDCSPADGGNPAAHGWAGPVRVLADRVEDGGPRGAPLSGDALMPAKKPTQLVALSTFTAEVDGDTVLVHAGDRFPSDSPVVEGREGPVRGGCRVGADGWHATDTVTDTSFP